MTTTIQTKQNSITVNTLKQKIDNKKDLVNFDFLKHNKIKNNSTM